MKKRIVLFFKVNIRKYMILDSKKVRKTFYIGAKVILYLKNKLVLALVVILK